MNPELRPPILPGTPLPVEPSQPTPPQDFNKTRRRESWKSTVSTILILIIAPLIALFLTTFVFQSYEVDGPSMETTLQDRDRLIVWKLRRSIARVGGDFIPDRGEVIVFTRHELEHFDSGQNSQLIKRVIGLPGERVVVRDNEVTVYNSDHPEGFNPDKTNEYTPILKGAQANLDMVIPKGEVFVMGDNRPNSLDSRMFGTVSAEDIVGTLALRIFPINKAESY